jgi:multidrug efflux pump subunit AcrA (membrane-fusion protein)
MHPQIIKQEPGNCPVCGMKLTPIRANSAAPAASPGERRITHYRSTMVPGETKPSPGKDSMGMDMVPVFADEPAQDDSLIWIDAGTIQRMNLRTGLVEHGPVRREFRTFATVAYDEAGLRDITTKYEGWIETLHVNATGSVVKAGDPLFDIYSPDLHNAQLAFLVAVRTENDGPLTRAARERLELLDLPEYFIAQLAESREPRRTFTFRAPAGGVVIEKMAVAGQMTTPGERLYRLADLRTVWVHARIHEKDLPFVSEGQAVSVRTSCDPEMHYEGNVQVLLPAIDDPARTATARIGLPNPDGFLRPGMFVEVGFTVQLADDAVLVPGTAVLRSGERNTVFVALGGGAFEPREIALGARSKGNFHQVLRGLKAGERIVTSGQFMLDSESRLREAIQKMQRHPAAPPEGPAPAPAPEPRSPGAVAPTPASNSPAPAGVAALLRPIAFAAADAAASLAVDDLDGYRRRLPDLRTALRACFDGGAHAAHSPLDPFREGLPDPAGLAEARRQFEPFSTVVADLARAAGLHQTAQLHVFECPMAPVSGRARWLQREAGTMNPFFGSEMLRCGEEIAGGSPTK